MEQVQVSISVGKESKEVVDALAVVVAECKKHAGDPKEIPAELLAHFSTFIAAVQGFQAIPEEIKGPGLKGVSSYLVHEVVGQLVG